MNKWLIKIWLALLSLAPMSLAATPASANFHTDTYQYIVGQKLLCDFPEPKPCPDISKDVRLGDRVELKGEGTFRVHPQLITGGGSVVHKNEAGEVLGTGAWRADRLLAFVPYGCGGEEGIPDNFCGGLTIMKIIIDPDDPSFPNIPSFLFVNCLIGHHPEGQHEGVQLLVPRFALWFNHELSGLTLFIKQPVIGG